MTGKEFYFVEELAKKLRLSNMTIYRYIKAKKLKAYKLGKGFRIAKDEFLKIRQQVIDAGGTVFYSEKNRIPLIDAISKKEITP